MIINNTMKKKLINWLKGFITAYAFTAVINPKIQYEWYLDKVDFIIANIFELLGTYNFVFLLVWVACTCFFFFMDSKEITKANSSKLLSLLFALILPMGQVLYDTQTITTCFASPVNVIKFAGRVIGFFLFFEPCLAYITDYLQKKNFLTDKEHFLSRKPFIKSFIALIIGYSPIILISFPGNLNADTIGQIYQVYGEMPYSSHHPLASTLLTGGIVKGIDTITGSLGLGLFAYVILQTLLLSAALASTIAYLSSKKISKNILYTLLTIYILTPVYSNITSTAIKDVVFISFVIGYIVCLAKLLDEPEIIKNIKFDLSFVLIQTAMILFRNNGLYIAAFTGIIYMIAKWKILSLREKIKSALVVFVVSIILASGINSGLSHALNAQGGTKADMLCLPFQIVGRYLTQYPDDLNEYQKSSIENVLCSTEEIAGRYRYDLADGIKAKYKSDASMGEFTDFVFAVVSLCFKHPVVCIDAVLVHTYGWYTPNVSNAIRYETPHDDFLTPVGIGEVIDKGLVFFYRFLDRISLLGALQNVGLACWILFFVTRYLKKNGSGEYLILTAPLWISFLICLDSPAFWEHPRYGFPILFTIPFILILAVAGPNKRN